MSTFSTKLVCQTSGGAPLSGPLYVSYPVPDVLFEGKKVPLVDGGGQFFGIMTGPSEHLFGNLYRVHVIVEGLFPRQLWPDAPLVMLDPGFGKHGYLCRRQ